MGFRLALRGDTAAGAAQFESGWQVTLDRAATAGMLDQVEQDRDRVAPFVVVGWTTVERIGSETSVSSSPSNPITAMSSGTLNPASRRACSAPEAIASLATKTPSGMPIGGRKEFLHGAIATAAGEVAVDRETGFGRRPASWRAVTYPA